jgi:hypothetical protein
MSTIHGLGMAAMLMCGLALAGCADCFNPARRPMGFVASPPRRQPIAAHDAPQSAVEKCTQALYLGGASTPDDMRAAEEKCRALIVQQPY